MSGFATRQTTAQDISQVLQLYPKAFPDEDLRPVVAALLEPETDFDVLSMATFEDSELIAHVLFTICGTREVDQSGALLAPLGVTPSHQRRGLGASLVRAGLETLEASGTRQVFVLGDPAYYGRFGFRTESAVRPPYALPEEWEGAWQSILISGRTPLDEGPLFLPEPWMDPALWRP